MTNWLARVEVPIINKSIIHEILGHEHKTAKKNKKIERVIQTNYFNLNPPNPGIESESMQHSISLHTFLVIYVTSPFIYPPLPILPFLYYPSYTVHSFLPLPSPYHSFLHCYLGLLPPPPPSPPLVMHPLPPLPHPTHLLSLPFRPTSPSLPLRFPCLTPPSYLKL